MKPTNLFNIYRFEILLRQNVIHNFRLVVFSVAGLCGSIFILLFLLQSGRDFKPLDSATLLATFLALFFVVGIIYSGTAFPGLRTKEKSYRYLLTPVSTVEKFIFEFLSRIVLFVLVIPIIFWLIYVLEGYFAGVVIPDFHFEMVPVFDFENLVIKIDGVTPPWVYVLIASVVLMIFIIPFTGAATFMKYPLLKTIFSVAIVFFFHFFVILFFVKVLHINQYQPADKSILFIKSSEGAIRFFAIYTIIINLALIAVAYLKLKEKEV